MARGFCGKTSKVVVLLGTGATATPGGGAQLRFRQSGGGDFARIFGESFLCNNKDGDSWSETEWRRYSNRVTLLLVSLVQSMWRWVVERRLVKENISSVTAIFE